MPNPHGLRTLVLAAAVFAAGVACTPPETFVDPPANKPPAQIAEETPELSSLALFVPGAFGLASYAMNRRRSQNTKT